MPVYDPFAASSSRQDQDQEIYDPFAEPVEIPRPGFFGKSWEAVKGTASNIGEDIMNPPISSGLLKFTPVGPAVNALQVGGDISRGAQDILGAAAGSALNTAYNAVVALPIGDLSPEEKQAIFEQRVQNIKSALTNPENYPPIERSLIKLGISAYKKGKPYFDLFEQSVPPVVAQTVRNAIDVATMVPAGKIMAKPAQSVVRTGREVPTELSNLYKDLTLAPKVGEELISAQNKIIDDAVAKTFLNKGMWRKGWKRTQDWVNDARSAIRSIVKHPEMYTERLPDGTTRGMFFNEQRGTYHTTPQNFPQFATAVDIAERNFFNRYDSMLRALGDRAPKVTTERAVDILDLFIDDMKKSRLPNAEKHIAIAEKWKQHFQQNPVYNSLSDVQSDIRTLNAQLLPFKSLDNPAARIRHGVLKVLRSDLEKAIDQVSGLGREYSQIKRDYGALRAVDKDIGRIALREAGKPEDYVSSLTDVVSGSMMVKALLAKNPAMAGAAIAGREIAKWKKRQQDRNLIIRNMFNKVKELEDTRNFRSATMRAIHEPSSPLSSRNALLDTELTP